MKKIIIKILSLSLAFIIILLTLMSCDPTTDQGEQNGGNNNTNGGSNSGSTSTSHYYGVKTLYSYDDVMDALAIVRQRRNVDPTYTVKDMGEDYTIFYQFLEPHYNRPYPIDYDVFFTSQSSGFFYTVIFFENQTCSSEDHLPKHSGGILDAYKEDEDYEKLRKYMNENACVNVFMMNHYNDNFFAEIGFIENLSYYRSSSPNEYEYYVCLFGGIEIIKLSSCVELDDAFFKLLFKNIVTTSVKE